MGSICWFGRCASEGWICLARRRGRLPAGLWVVGPLRNSDLILDWCPQPLTELLRKAYPHLGDVDPEGTVQLRIEVQCCASELCVLVGCSEPSNG